MKKINQIESIIKHIGQNAGKEEKQEEINFIQKTKQTNFSWDE